MPFIFLLILFILSESFTFGEDADLTANEKSKRPSLSDIFDGYFELRNFTYFRNDYSDDKISRIEGIFKLEYEKYIGSMGKILVSPKIRFDNDNYSSGYDR